MQKYLTIVVLLFTNCGYESSNPAIVQGIYYTPSTLDPAKISDPVANQIVPHIVETLVILDSNGTISPWLAETWNASEDFSQFTFKLKDNVFFHDGNKLTAEDVSHTFLRQYDKNYPYYERGIPNIYENSLSNILAGIVVKSESELTFLLKKPNVLFLYLLTSPYECGILSKYSTAQAGHDFVPVGTGPFIFDKQDYKESIILCAFNKYHGVKPIISKITYKVGKQQLLESMALKDSMDILYGIRGSTVEMFRSNSHNHNW